MSSLLHRNESAPFAFCCSFVVYNDVECIYCLKIMLIDIVVKLLETVAGKFGYMVCYCTKIVPVFLVPLIVEDLFSIVLMDNV